MPISRNRKKHKTQLAKRNKAIKLKKADPQKKILQWMAQMEEMKKKQMENPTPSPETTVGLIQDTNNIVEAEIITTEESEIVSDQTGNDESK